MQIIRLLPGHRFYSMQYAAHIICPERFRIWKGTLIYPVYVFFFEQRDMLYA